MTRMWAVEKYIDHWDGYSGHAEAGLRPNNYYLFSELSGRFQMLPWGTDQTWIPTIGVGTPGREVTFDGHGGVLFDKCLEDPQCKLSYWEALGSVTKAVEGLDPDALATQSADLLAPWQQVEREHGRPEFNAGEVEDGLQTTLDFIASRPEEAEEWLEQNAPPKPPKPPVAPPAQPSSSPPHPIDALLPGRAFHLGRVARSAKLLIVHANLTGPGLLKLEATMSAPGGAVTVCTDRERARQAGSLTLRCRLSAAALGHLSRRALPLELAFRCKLADGRVETARRQVTLPKAEPRR
jgi:CotH protein